MWRQLHRTTLLLIAALAVSSLNMLTPPVWGKKNTVKVWVDDARTRKITVPRLECEKIAEATREQLTTFGLSFASIGFSINWERQKGIEFDDEAEKLIHQVKRLCREFNSGSLTLKAYNAKMREINAAEEKGREFRARLVLVTKLRAQAAMEELDKRSGLPTGDIQESKQAAETELARFKNGVEDIPYNGILPRLPTIPAPEPEKKKLLLIRIIEEHKNGIVSLLTGFKQIVLKVNARLKGRTDMMRIPRYRGGGKTILVAKLRCQGLLDEVNASLTFRPNFLTRGLGLGAAFVLKESNRYEEAAQLLIIKYRMLCNEYNSGQLSQEEYLDRVQELYEAEEKARQARHQMFAYVRQQAEASHVELDREIADRGDPMGEELQGAMADMEDDMQEMGKVMASKKKSADLEKPTPSLVKKLTLSSRRESVEKKVAEFGQSVQRVRVAPPIQKIEVWQDDAKTRKVQVAKLDPDVIAQNVIRKLNLFIPFYNFGAEMSWAREKGLKYDHTTQVLIVKYKQLCVEFNSGLLSLETYRRRRQAIDEATERAIKFREEMFRMHQRLARAAFKELDRYIDVFNTQPSQ
jgi:hypothetical protein